jgi:hypothetical protein
MEEIRTCEMSHSSVFFTLPFGEDGFGGLAMQVFDHIRQVGSKRRVIRDRRGG